MLFMKPNFGAFGLMWDDQAVRYAFLTPRFLGGRFFYSYGKYLIKNFKGEDAASMEPEFAMRELKQALAYSRPKKLPTKKVVFGLPSHLSSVYLLRIPIKDSVSLKTKIYKKINAELPLNLASYYWDYEILARGKKSLLILVGLTPQKIVDYFLQILDDAGLVPVSLEIDSFSILRSIWQKNFSGKNFLLANIGSWHTNLVIFSLGVFQFYTAVSWGEKNLLQTMMQKLSISEKKAEHLKNTFGIIRPYDSQGIDPLYFSALENFSQHLLNTVNFFEATHEETRKITEIILTGKGAQILGLEKFLQERIPQIKIKTADPFVNLEVPAPYIPPLIKHAPQEFASVLGLAMKGFNL